MPLPVTYEGKPITDLIAHLRRFVERLDGIYRLNGLAGEEVHHSTGNHEMRPWSWGQEKGHGATVFLYGQGGKGWADLGTMGLSFPSLDGLCLSVNNLHHFLNLADAMLRIQRCHGCDPDQDRLSVEGILAEPEVSAALTVLRDRSDVS